MKTVVICLALSVNVMAVYCAEQRSEPSESTKKIQELNAIVSNEENYQNTFKEKSADGSPMIGQSKNIDQVADAIIQLGKLRAVEAIPFLIKHINFSDIRDGYKLSNRPVVVQALVDIGEPAVGPILDASKREDDAFRLLRMARVLAEMKGKQAAIQMIESESAQVTDTRVGTRLEKLKSFVREPPANVF